MFWVHFITGAVGAIVGIVIWKSCDFIKWRKLLVKSLCKEQHCNNCKKSFPGDDETFKYCPHCGQKLTYHINFINNCHLVEMKGLPVFIKKGENEDE